MITQGVITASLIGIVIVGIIPLIGGIALLAMGKIKASSFWAGVLAFIIAMIVFAILSLVLGFSLSNMAANNPAMLAAITAVILALALSLSMGVCIGVSMKTRTFMGAVSCGLGYAASYMIFEAAALAAMYMTFGMVNSGEFDAQYAKGIEAGLYEKADFNAAKEQITSVTAADLFSETFCTVAFAAMVAAAAIFIMRGVCSKNLPAGMGAAFITIAAGQLASLIPNTVAAVIVSLAIGAAALIFAVRMKDNIVPPEKPAVQDPFLDSVANARTDDKIE